MDRRAARLVTAGMDDFSDAAEDRPDAVFEASARSRYSALRGRGRLASSHRRRPDAMEIRYAALGEPAASARSGSCSIGATRWQTSLFPHRGSGGFILLLKAEVRRREGSPKEAG